MYKAPGNYFEENQGATVLCKQDSSKQEMIGYFQDRPHLT